MKFENTEVFNFEGAIRGMRNPKESWILSDSRYETFFESDFEDMNMSHRLPQYIIGKNDLELMQRLIRAGSEHRKFMRQIFVSVDITAPLYWWKEFDTYKVGTVANSESTMFKLASTPITMDCFEMGDFNVIDLMSEEDRCTRLELYPFWKRTINYLESLRCAYNETKDKRYWKELIRLLPESWLQKRTVTMNYENLYAMCSADQRRNHKLTEWSEAFMNWAKELPYAEELIFLEKKND